METGETMTEEAIMETNFIKKNLGVGILKIDQDPNISEEEKFETMKNEMITELVENVEEAIEKTEGIELSEDYNKKKIIEDVSNLLKIGDPVDKIPNIFLTKQKLEEIKDAEGKNIEKFLLKINEISQIILKNRDNHKNVIDILHETKIFLLPVGVAIAAGIVAIIFATGPGAIIAGAAMSIIVLILFIYFSLYVFLFVFDKLFRLPN